MFEFGLAFPREVGAVAVRVAEHCDPYVPRVLKSKWTLAAVCALAVALRMAVAVDLEGWFHTGDLGLIDAEGTIFIHGRSKTVILGPSGQNIYPEEIEEIGRAHV